MAKQVNFVIEQGETYKAFIYVTVPTDNSLPVSVTNPEIPMVFTGCTAKLQIRRDVDTTNPAISLTTGAGLTLGAGGKITIDITAAQSSAVSFAGKIWEGVFDLKIINGTTVTKPAYGNVTIKRDISRS